MRDHRAMTQTIEISDNEQPLNSLVDLVARDETRVVFKRNGVLVAGIVSADDLRRLDRLDREREERFRALTEFGAGFVAESPEDIEREAAKAVAQAREELRAMTHQAAATP